MFYDFLKIFGKSSEIFGSARKSSERLRKSSEIFGKFPDVIENVRNGSQELKSFGAGFGEVLKWTPVNCCAQVMTEVV